jgi:hypothetical protein
LLLLLPVAFYNSRASYYCAVDDAESAKEDENANYSPMCLHNLDNTFN